MSTPKTKIKTQKMRELIKILRDIAKGRTNELGDHWSTDWCNNAADYIEDVQKGEVYVCHMDTEVLFVGTEEDCQTHKDAQPFNTYCWKINKLADYGSACYEEGYEMAEPQCPEM